MKNFIIFIIISISFLGIYYLNYKITSYDMSYYQGKDGGFSVRLYWTCIMNAILYGVGSNNPHVVKAIIGVLVGAFAMGISYIIINLMTDFSGIYYHIIATILSIIIFIIIKKNDKV